MVLRLTLLYRVECWPIKKSHIQKTKVVEMRMIHRICGHTRLDKIRNKVIIGKIGVASIDDKIRNAKLCWFGHIRRRKMDAPVRRCERLDRPDYRRSRSRPKKSWIEVIRHDLKALGLVEDMTQNR